MISKHVYRLDRIAEQRPDSSSAYPAVRWLIVRRDDARVVGQFDRRGDAIAFLQQLTFTPQHNERTA